MTTLKLEMCDAATRGHRHTSQDTQSSTDSDASVHDHTAVPEDKRCKYPSKYCGRARVRKSNGTFHRFCQYHRVKANTNQKRWTSVRRQQAAQEEQHRRRAGVVAAARQSFPIHHRPESTVWMPELLPDPVSLGQSDGPLELPLEDVQILRALFGGEWQPTLDVFPRPMSCHPTVYKPHAFDQCDIAL